MSAVETRLWSFSLRVYAAPGVADGCLWLQDRHGLDVNVLLFCVWAGLTRGEVEGALVAEAEALSREWSSRVVQGLRAARRGLAASGHEELYSDVKRVELAAEKIEQEGLERLVQRLPVRELAPAEARRSARRNLASYLATLGAPVDSDLEARLATLIGAAIEDEVKLPGRGREVPRPGAGR